MSVMDGSLICAGGGGSAAGVVTGMDAALEEEREAARRGALLDRRRWRKDEREQLDEMLPKATGRWYTLMFSRTALVPRSCGGSYLLRLLNAAVTCRMAAIPVPRHPSWLPRPLTLTLSMTRQGGEGGSPCRAAG